MGNEMNPLAVTCQDPQVFLRDRFVAFWLGNRSPCMFVRPKRPAMDLAGIKSYPRHQAQGHTPTSAKEHEVGGRRRELKFHELRGGRVTTIKTPTGRLLI